MKKIILPALAASMIALTGCQGGGGSEPASAGMVGQVPAGGVGPGCQGGDKTCVALKYVVYNVDGKAAVSPEQVTENLGKINANWAQCGIAFQVDKYEAINAEERSLTTNTADHSELDSIRKQLEDDDTLLLVTTGKWNRSGSLGNTGANAWASMPGENLYGVVMESSVGTFGNIIAHELGHYLGLPHASNTSQLMNPVIYDTSTKLTEGECATAHETIAGYWTHMQR